MRRPSGRRAAEFRVLGPLEVWHDGDELRLHGRKRQVVLAALLLASGRPVSLGRLVDAVWDEAPPASATKLIRNAVSDLRLVLADMGCSIDPVAHGYRLDVGDGVFDAGVFARQSDRARRLVEEGRTADAVEGFRAALALWRGPALDGLDSPELRPQVVGLDEQRMAALEDVVDLELALGRHLSLVGELSRWVAENPLRERLVAQLMVALYRSAAQAKALGVYEQTRRALQQKLGINPGPELREVHRRILVNHVALAPPPMGPRPPWSPSTAWREYSQAGQADGAGQPSGNS